MRELVLATRNDHKVAEVTRLLAPFGLTVIPLPRQVVLPPEDGDTYSANALIKARAAARALGRAVIADDSGVEAEALGGRPGVRSARYAGEHATDAENLTKLIAEVPVGSGLRYVCALAFVDADSEHVLVGESSGRMAPAPRGEGGFGYDPVFIPESAPEVTLAELSQAGKDAISHRGNALRAFADWYLPRLPRA
ncbi:MAG TPA: RdgB/HAM1 family non-canonical purine NTP pyrophosphatase [Solirubrobacteraceae bacterium]|jgi:XTP/dITP diphosphohydrolase|nr:RdgB/HAM1 family non-canonical purine NTP pyrophosphatase [Solirubrobacteraceae bacterium]